MGIRLPRRRWMIVAQLGALALLASSCGERDRVIPSVRGFDGGVLHFDAAMLAGADGGVAGSRDAGTTVARDAGSTVLPDAATSSDAARTDAGRDAGVMLPPAVRTSDGVLTPYPGIDYFVSIPGFTIESANFGFTDDGSMSGPLVELYLEIRNNTGAVRCGFVPAVDLDGDRFVSEVVADPHYADYGTGAMFLVTTDCIPVGGIGVLHGDQRGIRETDLSTAVRLTVDPHPFVPSGVVYRVPTDAPSRAEAVVATTEGWVVRGTATPQRRILNYSINVYARDDRGVLFAEMLAFPGELAELPADVPVAFDTEAAPRAFTTYRAFHSWINRL